MKEDRTPSQIQGLQEVPDLIKKNRLKDAWDILDAHQDEFRDLDFIYVWQAVILQKNGQISEAESTLTDGLKLARQKHILCYRMGDLKYQSKDMGSAVKWWIRSIDAMYQTQTVDLWEPFLYLAYVARGYESQKHYNILMTKITGIFVHGELQLEKNEQENLKQLLTALPQNTILIALDTLCKKIHPDTGSDSPGIQPDGEKKEKSVSMSRKKQIHCFLLVILVAVICLSGYLIFSKKSDIIIHTPLPDVSPVEKKLPTSTAGEKPKSEHPPSNEPIPEKKKHPWLKLKTKTASPDIKKKSPNTDPIPGG